MEVTDQALLTRYLKGADDAFRELLDRHASLVYGVAVRNTSDPGAAEEVVQDVFMLLAKKARRLVSHPSVAGWLHLTSRNLARHARRRRLTRDRHLFSFAKESRALHAGSETGERTNRIGEEVDDCVQRLPKGEREAILLRFYEDREYGEIAHRLDISEEAARKRVSRALKRIQKSLGLEHAGGATFASLAVMPPPGVAESIASGIPAAAAAATTSTTTGVLAIMTKQTAIKLGAAAVLGGSLLYYEVNQQQEKRRLVDQLALREAAQESPAEASRENAESAAADLVARTDAKWAGQVADLERRIDAERAKTKAAEERIAELEAVTAQFDDEVVIAYGKIEEIGSSFGSIFAEAVALSEIEKLGELDNPENTKRYWKFIESAASLSGLSREIIKFDGDPEEGSRFFAATYAELFDLDETTTGKIQEVLEGRIGEAVNRGLTLSDLPREKALENPDNPPQEVKSWLKTRQTFYRDVRNDLRNLVPLSKQADFDKWVEKDGIGFKNIKLKEHNLAFSLGGDQ